MNVATEASSEGITALQARLADPHTAQALDRLLDRLDVLAFLLDSAEGFLSRGETVADSLAEGFAELKRTELLHDDGGSDSLQTVAESLPELAKMGGQVTRLAGRCDLEAVADSGVVEKLTDPETLRTLSELLERLDTASFALQATDGFLSRGEVVADSLADGVAELKRLETDETVTNMITVFTEGLPKMTQAASQMMQSGMLDANVVGTLGEIGTVVAEAHAEAKANPPQPLGLFGLMRAMRDPQIQSAMGLAMHVAKRVGEHTEQSQG